MYRAKRGRAYIYPFLPSVNLVRGERESISPQPRKQVVPPVDNFHLIYSIRQTTSSLANTIGGRSDHPRLVFSTRFLTLVSRRHRWLSREKTFGFTLLYLAILSRAPQRIFRVKKKTKSSRDNSAYMCTCILVRF